MRISPDIDLTLPISRSIEAAFLDYYGYPYHWGGPHLWDLADLPGDLAKPKELTTPSPVVRSSAQGRHTHSATKIAGYHLPAADGKIGHVEDFIIEDES